MLFDPQTGDTSCHVLTYVIVQNVRIGYSMLSDAEEIEAISPGKVNLVDFLVYRTT